MTGTELYILRINAVIDYIETHLEEKLNLDELSRVAQFSKYHFHRIFTAFMGESLYSFITRLRVERAAAILPQRGLQPADGYCFEHYFADCYDPATGKTSLSIAVPVKEI